MPSKFLFFSSQQSALSSQQSASGRGTRTRSASLYFEKDSFYTQVKTLVQLKIYYFELARNLYNAKRSFATFIILFSF
ncbi:MAG: hypothetical protein IJG23_00065, partial [Clostridia bacterium]|nr:hypothetical protein [Clostridia bacterium]